MANLASMANFFKKIEKSTPSPMWAAVAVAEAAHLSVCDERLYATLAPTAARSPGAATVGPDEVCMMVTGWGSRERSERGFLGPASAASGVFWRRRRKL